MERLSKVGQWTSQIDDVRSFRKNERQIVLPLCNRRFQVGQHPLFSANKVSRFDPCTPTKSPGIACQKTPGTSSAFNGKQVRLAKGRENEKAVRDAFYKQMANESGSRVAARRALHRGMPPVLIFVAEHDLPILRMALSVSRHVPRFAPNKTA